MVDTTANRLRRHLLNLGSGELAAAFAFAWLGVFAGRDDPTGRVGLPLAAVGLVVVLVEGGCFWLLARGWMPCRRMPRTLARIYLTLRWVTPLIFVLSAIGLAMWWPSLPHVRVLGVSAVSFGVTEYVNYFIRRVSYPVATWWRDVRRLRQPRLIHDVRRSLAPN
jgi:hypothetical protein